ncbi:MAG: glycosyltransferase family 4 protein [Steroidobacteraceae bacterium]
MAESPASHGQSDHLLPASGARRVGGRRLSICYVVPGHDLVLSSGPTRNVLNLARELSRWADVTVAFRQRIDATDALGFNVVEIQPRQRAEGADDSAMRGIGYGDFLSYLKAIRRFAHHELGPFDVVLEKSWLISGYVSALCRRRGQLGVPVENIVQNPAHAASGQMAKLVRMHVAGWLAGRAIRGAPLIIAETEFLRKEIAAYWRVPLERIAVVDLGVDRKLFHPIDQGAAREACGLPQEATLLMYIGVLDRTHNLEPAIRAVGASADAGIELHVVGDGVRRAEYESLAASSRARVVFHGKVEHERVPWFIAAADLCLAPYDSAAFSSGELGYSTMKIPEYLSVGRAVVSVPSGRIRTLVKDGETGFLFANEPEGWARFLRALPSRDRLREMGESAAASKLTSWEDTALGYLSLCESALAAKGH